MNEFNEALKKVLLLGIGAAALTADKSKELIEELVKRGEITVDQGKVLNEELKQKAASKISDSMMGRVEKMSKEERDALRAKLAELDREDAVEAVANVVEDITEGDSEES